MPNRIKTDYEMALKAIRPFTKLGINNRKHFTSSQKRQITIYVQKLKFNGFLEYKNNKYIQKFKFVKNKKSTIKYLPKLSGEFIPGAGLSDKVTVDKQTGSYNVHTEFYNKTFIPCDFTHYLLTENKNYISDKINKEFKKVKLTKKQYITIVFITGRELGGSTHKTKIGGGADRKIKLLELKDRVTGLLDTSIQRYKVSSELIKGFYIYTFKNQRGLNNAEKKAINT